MPLYNFANKDLSNLNNLGVAAQVLTSNGPSAAPTFQAAAGGGTPYLIMSSAFEATTRFGNAGTNDSTVAVGTGGMTISSVNAQNAGRTLRIEMRNKLMETGLNYLVNIQFKGNGATSGHNYFFGIQSNDDTVSIADTGITTSGALVFGIKGVGDGTNIDWTSINADGGGNETSNAFISNQASDTANNVQIEVTGTSSIKFYNNGTLVNTHTTNLPTGGAASTWAFVFASTNNAGSGTAVATAAHVSVTQIL